MKAYLQPDADVNTAFALSKSQSARCTAFRKENRCLVQHRLLSDGNSLNMGNLLTLICPFPAVG